jgi:hypothetical protein
MMVENLAYQWRADSVAARSIAGLFAPFVTNSELWDAWVKITEIENTHALTYSEIVRQCIPDVQDVFNRIMQNEQMEQRMSTINEAFAELDVAGAKYKLGMIGKEETVHISWAHHGNVDAYFAYSLLDIVKEQRAAAEAVLPFIHQRMPLAIEIDKASRPVLIVGTPTADQVASAASSLGLDLRAALKPAGAVDDVEYQEVSPVRAGPSPLEPSPHPVQRMERTEHSSGSCPKAHPEAPAAPAHGRPRGAG